MSAVAWTEFLCGPLDVDELRVMAHIIGEPVPFTSGEGVRAAEIFNDTGCRRGSLTDCMIAASALNAGAALATANPGDFRRIPGLTVLAAGAAVSG